MGNKVLIIASEFPPGPGGIGVHAFSLAKELARREFRVFVVADADYVKRQAVDEFDAMLNDGLSISRVFRKGVWTYFNRFRTSYKVASQEQILSVVASGKFSLWIGAFLKLLKPSVRLICIVHGSEVNISGFFLRKLTHLCLKKADVLVPVSNFTQGLLPEGIRRKNCVVVPNGIDLREFTAEVAESTDKWIGQPSLLTVGNVTPRKGQQRVIRSLPKLIKIFPQIHYHVVGLPTYKDEFLNLAVNLGVADHVTFHGRLASRHELYLAYRKTDCFVILSENQADGDVEGFGIVILEANFFGQPAIGAKGCGIEDAICDNYNGKLVDGDNPADIANALSQILADVDNYGTRAKQWARQHDWKSIGNKFEELLTLNGDVKRS